MNTQAFSTSFPPGTCGEFIQGFLSDGEPFHVTLPITIGTKITVSKQVINNSINLSNFPKISKAIQIISNKFNVNIHDHWLYRVTELVLSRGMASSTADILAATHAFSQLYSYNITHEELADICVRIESSDGIAYPGIVAFNHKNGRLIKQFNNFPDFNIILLIPNKSVDTDQVNFKGKEKLGEQFELLLDKLNLACASSNESEIAECSTHSAELNEKYLVNPLFNEMLSKYSKFGALGLNVGHTGSMVGMLFSSNADGYSKASEAYLRLKSDLMNICDVRITKVEKNRLWQ